MVPRAALLFILLALILSYFSIGRIDINSACTCLDYTCLYINYKYHQQKADKHLLCIIHLRKMVLFFLEKEIILLVN